MPPPPTGSIVGQVSIEGMGVDGVTVSLSNGASTATAGGGNYRFDTVEQGSYTVTISGFPADASFDATSAPANIGETGGTVTRELPRLLHSHRIHYRGGNGERYGSLRVRVPRFPCDHYIREYRNSL